MTCHQDALQDAVPDTLREVVAASAGLGTALVVGAPLGAEGLLFNCAVMVCEGTVRGVPKSYLPKTVSLVRPAAAGKPRTLDISWAENAWLPR